MLADFPRVFSLSNCVFLYGGLIAGGFGEGDAYTIKQAGDSWAKTVGVDGSVSWAYTGENSFDVEINLLQTSPMNAILSALHLVQTATGVFLPVGFKDGKGADTFKALAGLIVKMPDVARGNKIQTQTWMVSCAGGVLYLGGN